MIPTISASEVRKDLDKYVVIDVREPEEFAQGSIPSAINIPLSKFMDDLEVQKFVPPINKELVLSCRSGNRSGFATHECVIKGIKAKNLAGGFLAWQKLK